jgi:phosphoribosyl-AMP cyclohydrolase
LIYKTDSENIHTGILMAKSVLHQTEKMPTGEGLGLTEVLNGLPYNADGLIPAIAQQYDSLEVLMMAWMNRAAIEETLKTGRVCYWSRSRQAYWRKGESSGQVQKLKAMRFDCDGDTILLLVDQTGPACHTGRRDCFYNVVKDDEVVVDAEPLIDPEELYGKK